MTGPRPLSWTPSFASTGTTDSQNNAALAGASKAFGRPGIESRATANKPITDNGALAAAARVGGGRTTPSPRDIGAPCRSHSSWGAPSSPAASLRSARTGGWKEPPTLNANNIPNLFVPVHPPKERSKSPSHQAAQAAAARSPIPRGRASPTRARAQTPQKPPVANKPRRLSQQYSHVTDGQPDRHTDASPIQPTTSLVHLFERKSSNSPNRGNRRPAPIINKSSGDLALQSPKPVRTVDAGITSMFQMELEGSRSPPKAVPNAETRDHEPASQRNDNSLSDDDAEYVSASEDTVPASPHRRRQPNTPKVSDARPTPAHSPGRPRTKPQSPTRRPTSARPIMIRQTSPRKMMPPPVKLSASSQSGPSINAQWNQLHPRRVTPLNTGDDLANAMVASSLASSMASSRAGSPRKLEPPLPPTRRHKHHKLSFSRTPSPTKNNGMRMRQTLRKAESEISDSEDELHPYHKHQKKRHLRKHPNKHHEGDRKRWRDAVTERERKRYEGVWAANKGLYCSREEHSDRVSNIVTKDVWARSRLPFAALEVVWDLVADEGDALCKEQFVVGMWLIDQRLKGRKLPVKVQETVWTSVRGIHGIKIRK